MPAAESILYGGGHARQSGGRPSDLDNFRPAIYTTSAGKGAAAAAAFAWDEGSRSSGRGAGGWNRLTEVLVSIVRVGLAETKNFAEGYEAIFGKKKAAGQEKKEAKEGAGTPAEAPKKKKAKKKK
jgi:hypothetical protein